MRRLIRFQSPDGSYVLNLPLLAGKQDESYTGRTAIESVPLAAFGWDLLGSAQVLPEAAEIRVTATLVGEDAAAQLRHIRQVLRRVGRGQLWAEDDGSVQRWCWARGSVLGSYSVEAGKPLQVAVTIGFVRLSDWFPPTPSSVTQVLATSPGTVTVASLGDVPTSQLRLTLVASGTVGTPAVQNIATGESVSSTRTLASGQCLRIDGYQYRVLFSPDGTNWTDDRANTAPGPLQTALLRIAPGTNPIRVAWSGSGTVTVTVEWHDAYV